MIDRSDLDRFLAPQDEVIDDVRRELATGQKRTHWMWFIFPQLRGLGHSATARHFGIASVVEARAYLAHPVLGPRLVECTELVNQVEGKTALQIFGSPDDMKFRSCMTLFGAVQPAPFTAALAKYYGSAPDPLTLGLLADAP